MSETKRPYVAFISYSHRDTVWAAWIQKAIERYSLPSSFAKSTGLDRRLGKVFRDREELSTGQNLGDHLLEALDNSDNLIVICSPNAVSSQWVGKEIEYFKSIGRGDRIFALLVEGGAEALPEPLLTDVRGNPLEPLAADPRKEADGKRLAKLKIISGILNTNLDQLVQRERARQRQQRGLFLAAANVVALSIGSALYFEQAQRYEAEQKALERELGIQNVMSMTDFVKRTRQYYDKAALKYVSDEFSEYLDRFNDAELTTDQKAAKADALRVVGESTYDLGDVETSLKAYGESRDLYQSASTLRPDDVDLAIEAAFSDFYVGVTHFYEGNLASAKQPLERYADQISTLFNQNPDHPVLLSESVAAPNAVLTLLVESSNKMNTDLAVQIEKATSAVDFALAIAPSNAEILYLSQGPMDYAADAHMKSCEVFDALPYQKRAVDYARKAVELDPRNRQYRTNLANALFSLAELTIVSADFTEAVPLLTETYELQNMLFTDDPENRYLANRILTTKLQMLRITTELKSKNEALSPITTILEKTDFTELANEAGNERSNAEIFFRLTNFLISEGDWRAARASSSKMVDAS